MSKIICTSDFSNIIWLTLLDIRDQCYLTFYCLTDYCQPWMVNSEQNWFRWILTAITSWSLSVINGHRWSHVFKCGQKMFGYIGNHWSVLFLSLIKDILDRKIFRSFHFRRQKYGVPFEKTDLTLKWLWRSWARSNLRSPSDYQGKILQLWSRSFFSMMRIFQIIQPSRNFWHTMYKLL